MNTDKHRWVTAAFGLRLSAFSCLLLAPCTLLLTSCNVLPEPQADPVRHFTLGGEVGAAPVANATQVRPVRVAGHLHGRALAVRVGEHEVIYREEVRWAEPLDVALTGLLRARLGVVGGGATVAVEVERFEPVRNQGNSVQLAAAYTITPDGSGKEAVRHGVFTSSPRTWDGKDPGALVDLMRAAAGELGDAIAAAVESVGRDH
jgi:uncharacterized lipoprotein YmbA